MIKFALMRNKALYISAGCVNRAFATPARSGEGGATQLDRQRGGTEAMAARSAFYWSANTDTHTHTHEAGRLHLWRSQCAWTAQGGARIEFE